MRQKLDGCVALVTTPRSEKPDEIAWMERFLTVGSRMRLEDPRIGPLVIAMPWDPSAELRERLVLQANQVLSGTVPAAQGVGPIFHGAGEIAFRNPHVSWFIHLPFDLDWDNPHDGDVQHGLPKLLDSLAESAVRFVIGDYTPKLWIDGAAAPHPIKDHIEEHVRNQVTHYFGPEFVRKFDLKAKSSPRRCLARWRSEFFAVERELFKKLGEERRFAPWDPVPGILIYCERTGCEVRIPYLGNFYEVPPLHRNVSSSIRDQVFRSAVQIATEYLRDQHQQSLSNADLMHLARGPWREKVETGMGLAFTAMAEILALT